LSLTMADYDAQPGRRPPPQPELSRAQGDAGSAHRWHKKAA